ncbi:MAG: hypothetical protein MJY71_02445 [Bacteroidaceae bacterium]|nr:hypothetical protein [Bacteroidaceae bacterium]
MKHTAHEVQGDVIQMLQGSSLAQMLTGKVYRNGYRPRDSRKEDAVVIFTAGLSEQVQTGVVTIHIYVPDIELNGVWVENGARTAEIERAAQEWTERLTATRSNYLFTVQSTISTDEERDTQQHYVVIMLRYRLFEELN